MQYQLNSKVKRFIHFIIIPMLFLYTGILSADAIRLFGGQVLEGKILEESEKVLIIQTSKGTFTIKKVDILETERPNSNEKVIKAPSEPKLSPAKIAMLSFIPGYSPLYQSKEHPEYGIPFAMINLGYFYRFLQFQTNSRRVGFMDSVEMQNPVMKYLNLVEGGNFIGRTIALSNRIPNNQSIDFSNIYQFINFRSVIYNGHRDRVVAGDTMTEDEYLKIKKRQLTGYVTASIVQGVVAYFVLRGEGSLGALYKSEHNGVKTVFYAFPTNDGGIFGTVSRF